MIWATNSRSHHELISHFLIKITHWNSIMGKFWSSWSPGFFSTWSQQSDSVHVIVLVISSPDGTLCWKETDWGELSGALHQPLMTHWAAIHNFLVIRKSCHLIISHHNQDIEQFTFPIMFLCPFIINPIFPPPAPDILPFPDCQIRGSHTVWVWSISLSMIDFIFYWIKIAFQCYISFCCTAMWISHMYTFIPSCLILLPTFPPSPTLLVLQSTELSSLCSAQQLPTSYFTHVVVYICKCHSLNSSHPLLLMLWHDPFRVIHVIEYINFHLFLTLISIPFKCYSTISISTSKSWWIFESFPVFGTYDRTCYKHTYQKMG